MVVFSDKINEAELMEIWKQSFGDSEQYIRMFFEWNLAKTTVAAYMLDGKTVSVAYLLPVTYEKTGQAPIPCRYLYAAATLPEYRGQGYFGEIMKAIYARIPEPVLLVPGEKSLISYYEKQGMRVWLNEKVLDFSKVQERTVLGEISDISSSEYVLKRKGCLLEHGYINWDEHDMNYIFHENHVCGGFQKVISVSQEKYIAMYRVEDKTLKIMELLPQDDLIKQDDLKHVYGVNACVQLLLKETGCQKANVCLNPTVMITENFPVCKNEGYFNLTLG